MYGMKLSHEIIAFLIAIGVNDVRKVEESERDMCNCVAVNLKLLSWNRCI